MEPDSQQSVQAPVRKLDATTIALIGGLILLVLIVGYFATRGSSNQDKLTNAQVSTGTPASHDKICASSATYDLIKRDLFRRAAQLRGSDQAAFDKLSGYAVLRMENPVMESEDSSNGAVNCSGSLSLDLPPGVAVVGGRHTLSADVDYTVQPAADGSGSVVLLRNTDSIVAPLATLARINAPTGQTGDVSGNVEAPATGEPSPVSPPAPVAPQPPAAEARRPTSARPSFDCAQAESRSEVAVCSSAGLAALDRNMMAQFERSMAGALPEQQALLRRTQDRFFAYRDRCTTNACIGDAYVGRMREMRDIMQGRWQPPR